MGFECAADGFCGYWIGGAGGFVRDGVWFRQKWRAERRFLARFARAWTELEGTPASRVRSQYVEGG
jgi:hypothetical protein